MDEGGAVFDAGVGGRDMSNSNPRVKSILAAHPNQDVVICVAGCDGKPRAVQVLPRTAMGREGAFVPSATKTGRQVYGPPRPGQSVVRSASADNEVVCLAGCIGRPGQVVQRVPDLPLRTKVKSSKPRKPSETKQNEPLERVE